MSDTAAAEKGVEPSPPLPPSVPDACAPDPMAKIRKEPVAEPTSDSKAGGLPRLTAAEQEKYEWLLAQARGWTGIPTKDGKNDPLTDDEKLWLSRECLIRFLRATKFQERESEKRLRGTLAWRRDYGVDQLDPEIISAENKTGKQVIAGFDKHCRPCLYLNPARQNTDPSPRQVQHLVFMVERVLDLMTPCQETMVLLINFRPGKNRTNTAPAIGIGRECLHILQTHYPERLGKALIVNVPWVVWGFFKLIMPILDPRTREKVAFNSDLTQWIPKEQLWSDYPGGEMRFEYDHGQYWPSLLKMCREKKEARKKRWTAGGGFIGELEDFLSGHTNKGCAAPQLNGGP